MYPNRLIFSLNVIVILNDEIYADNVISIVFNQYCLMFLNILLTIKITKVIVNDITKE